jgi:hypothetical protein
MKTILSIPEELEYLESLVKLARKKDENVKITNLMKPKKPLTIRHICINKSHRSKTLHLLVQVGNNLVERLVDIIAFMSKVNKGYLKVKLNAFNHRV